MYVNSSPNKELELARRIRDAALQTELTRISMILIRLDQIPFTCVDSK